MPKFYSNSVDSIVRAKQGCGAKLLPANFIFTQVACPPDCEAVGETQKPFP